MTLRSIILSVAFLCAPLSLLVIALPITWGYGGWDTNSASIVSFLDPNGPAAQAGLRAGDRVIRMSGVEEIEGDSGNVGTVVQLHAVSPSGESRIVRFAFVPFSGQLALQEQFNKVLTALTALGAFVITILVVLRARDKKAGERAALVLLFAGLGAFCQGAALVCDNAWIGTLFYWIAPRFISGAIVWAALRFLAIYPPNPSPVRTILGRASLFALAWAIFDSAEWTYSAWTGSAVLSIGDNVGLSVGLLLDTALIVAIVDGIISARETYATPMRWLGGMWLVATAIDALAQIGLLAHVSVLGSHYGDVLGTLVVFFLAFGVAYPVLRHRLIDLNILVSRATVFGAASAIIVGAFVVAEWVIGRIFERSIGFSPQREGLVAEMLTLVVVLVLGISARSIHAFVEDRMTKTFFRKRMRGLAEIQRVAREADAATDPRAIMEIAASTTQRCLEPLGTALYLLGGDRYERVAAAGALAMPVSYAFNDEPALRLRRWQEAFELDDDSDDRHHILFVPMTLRSTVLGFLCCGPKPDRTAYLADEIAALSLLAHHVGIASAMLSRARESMQLAALAT
jgi:hypothetical protein